jgi:predicted P-loop ATPase
MTPREDEVPSRAEQIATALGKARRSGDGWKCLCPAHDDHNPSLCVTDGLNGLSVLLHCHAGCSQGAVIAAVRERGLWPHPSCPNGARFFAAIASATPLIRPNRAPISFERFNWAHVRKDAQAPVGVWPYFDAKGDFVFAACRFNLEEGKKEFRQLSGSTAKGARIPWRFGLTHIKAGERPLYNLDVLAANPNALVIVCEGEKAAEGAAKLFPNSIVTTSVCGATSPSKSDWSPLKGRIVLIWPDADDPGRKYARDVATILTGLGCSVEVVDAAALAAIDPATGGKRETAEGWDAADAVDQWDDHDKLREAVEERTRPFGSKEAVKNDDPQWQLTAKGAKQASYKNAAMGIAKLGLVCRHDIFHDRKIVEGDLQENLGPELSDAIGRAVREAIIDRFECDPGKDNVLEALERACEKNRFDPVCDYLDGLEWDNTSRVDNWLTIYFGAVDTPLTRAFGRMTLIAAVRRAKHPGCKFDTMLILEGPQGQGKSKALRILAVADDNFSDAQIKWDDPRQQQESAGGVWIHEIGELAGLKKAEVENVKQFLSRQSDRGRPAYGRYSINRLRRGVLIGTVNPLKGTGYLTDPTGNRRFWPVSVASVDPEGLARDRDQLWAEAAMLEAKGEPIELDPSLYPVANARQERRRVVDPWVHILQEKLRGQDRVSSVHLLTNLLEIPAGKTDRTAWTRLAAVMRQLNWEGPRVFRVPPSSGSGPLLSARGYERRPSRKEKTKAAQEKEAKEGRKNAREAGDESAATERDDGLPF